MAKIFRGIIRLEEAVEEHAGHLCDEGLWGGRFVDEDLEEVDQFAFKELDVLESLFLGS